MAMAVQEEMNSIKRTPAKLFCCRPNPTPLYSLESHCISSLLYGTQICGTRKTSTYVHSSLLAAHECNG